MQPELRGLPSVSFPRLLQVESGALAGLSREIGRHFDLSAVVVATGLGFSRALGEQVIAELGDAGCTAQLHSGLIGSLAEVDRVLARLGESPVSLVVAVGGGQPIDVAKLVACRRGVDLVVVPTVLSHDGMASPVASLIDHDGRRQSLGARMPAGVVIDVEVVGRAPERYARAGIGDLASNLTAVEDWRIAHAAHGEPFDELAASIALLSAKAATEVTWPLGVDDLAAVARGLVMSGLAMEIAGSSRPCSGAEHLVSHALDQLRGSEAGLHGEHVAIGVLITSVLQSNPDRERIRRLFARVGFPASMDGWGLDERTLVQAVQLAPGTRPERRTVLDHVDLSTAHVTAVVRSAILEGVG